MPVGQSFAKDFAGRLAVSLI